MKQKLSLKEKILYRFVFSEGRVYRHFYSRFLIAGVDLDRIHRVVRRIRSFFDWCAEWSREGALLERLAEEALSKGNVFTARRLFHEAAGCFHIGQHIYFLDLQEKNQAQEKVRVNYKRAIELYDEAERPIQVAIPFRNATIPGYLRLAKKPKRPLVVQINGLDNLKEIENHWAASVLLDAGFNVFAFDGPGQGEMRKSMPMIPDYEKAVSAIIDWFEENNRHDHLDLGRIGTIGMSFGGYLSPRSAAFDRRISCAVSIGGLGYLKADSIRGVNPIWIRELLYATAFGTMTDAAEELDRIDIRTAPPMDRPLLVVHGGKDRVVPHPRRQAEYLMDWAAGEKELKWYPDGEHCNVNYFDEIYPYAVDWLSKHLLNSAAQSS